MKRLFLTTTAFLALSASIAQAETYTIDPSHTNILLRVSHMGFSDMVLEALKPEGTIEFDATAPEQSSVDVTLHATAIDGDDEKFNAHLQSADFFNAVAYPVITFKSTGITITGEKTGTLTGDLSLLGVTKPVTLDVTFNQAAKNPLSGNDTIGFTATGTLKRSEFGVNYGLPAIGDDVGIDINIEAIQAQ